MKSPHLIEVTWIDACLRTRSDAEPQARPTTRRTVGYLAKRDAKYIVLAMTYDAGEGDESDEFDDQYTIPRAMIRSIRRLS